LAKNPDTYRRKIGNPASGPVLPCLNGGARCLDALYRRHVREPFKAAKIQWSGWHSFRRGLGTNLSELGIPDLLIQKILRHGDVETTRDSYILTRPGPVAAAMRTFSAEVARKSEARSQVVLKSDRLADEVVTVN
jgi:integrase